MVDIKEIESAIRFFKEEKEQAQHAPDDFCLAVDFVHESAKLLLLPMTLPDMKSHLLLSKRIFH